MTAWAVLICLAVDPLSVWDEESYEEESMSGCVVVCMLL